MSFEVEVKYRSVDHDRLARELKSRGAAPSAPLEQVDVYLSHPSRDFAQTKEALRIRRLGAENRITYKGPRHAGPTKTREEIELPLAEPGDVGFARLLRLFENLGFRPVAQVRKRRIAYPLTHDGRDLEVVLDQVDDLGEFAEVEGLASSESDLPVAQAAVLALAASLGLTEVEPRSYLRMILESSGPAL